MTTNSQEIVPEEQVSEAEPVLQEQVSEKETPQALTEERVQQLIAEATAKAVAEAKEVGKRELQSAQDRNRAETQRLERRARVAESTLSATKTEFGNVDPEVAKELELASYRAQDKSRREIEQSDAYNEQQVEVTRKFQENLIQHIVSLDIDPKDSRIDWAMDAPDLLTAQQRVLDSTAKIQKENKKTMNDSFEDRLKKMEAQLGKVNIEANSVETTASDGVVAGSDAEFEIKFGDGDLPMTKANIDRHKSIMSKYD